MIAALAEASSAGTSAFFILSQSGERSGRRNLALRHNAFETEVASVPKNGLAVAFNVLVETDAGANLGQHHFQCGLAASRAPTWSSQGLWLSRLAALSTSSPAFEQGLFLH